MQSALSAFANSMMRVRHLHALHASFSGQVTAVVDLSDLLRAEVVLAVSALDHYIHELTRLGMLECWRGQRSPTDAFKRFSLPAGATLAAMANASQAEAIFENAIRAQHSYATFQQPDKIADAVRLFSNVGLWDAVAARLGITVKDTKNALALIVDRRNKIAHEADTDPSFPGQRWPIDRAMVDAMLSTIEVTVEAIHAVVT
jgi:hypothetical protein